MSSTIPASFWADLSDRDSEQGGTSVALGRPKLGSRVGKRDLANITAQLAIMTQAGVDLTSALASLVRQCKQPVLQAILAQVQQSVLQGESVSDALRRHKHVFDNTYIASVAAGEASGCLPDVLKQLAELLRSEVKLRGTMKTMLAYPIVLLSVSGIVLLALTVFVLPRFANIFADFDAVLPIITQILLGIATELRTRYWIWLPLIVGSVIGGITFLRGPLGRRLWDRATLNAPVFKDVTRSLLIGRACRMLGIMIASGVPLLESLRLTKSAVKNSLYRGLFVKLENDVVNGRGLATAMLESEFIPGAASEMIVTAEKTGTLGMVTQMIGEHFEEEGSAKLKELVAFLEPALTVVMGVIVSIIVASVMLPLFDLSAAAK